jgi:uncharacterized C2H2 Zn-finger protein
MVGRSFLRKATIQLDLAPLQLPFQPSLSYGSLFSSIPHRHGMAWDLNLFIDWSQKIFVPFHYLVEPQPDTPTVQPFQFLRLPTDIQLIVYEHCDLPTLFHLMWTCSHTCGPATKLFWANPSETHWYHSDNRTLFAKSDHHPIIQHCPEFAQRTTRIELDLETVERYFADDTALCREPASRAVKAQYFWKMVGKAFPAVKRVVLTGDNPRQPLLPPPGASDEAFTAMECAVRCAPLSLTVQIALARKIAKPRYSLWQVTRDAEPSWHVIDADWTPTRILLPPRIFPASPLGDLLTSTRIKPALSLEERGVDWLKIESYARYALDGLIRCPRFDCDATFTERIEWDRHLRQNHSHSHFGWRYGYHEQDIMSELWCFKGTSQGEQDVIEVRQRHIGAEHEKARRLQRRVQYGWGGAGSEQRLLFEEQFYAQLREENFAELGVLRLDPEDPLACEWVNCLNMHFDPTHIYY